MILKKNLIITLVIMLTGILSAEEAKKTIVTLVTNHGNVTIELLQKSAPEINQKSQSK